MMQGEAPDGVGGIGDGDGAGGDVVVVPVFGVLRGGEDAAA